MSAGLGALCRGQALLGAPHRPLSCLLWVLVGVSRVSGADVSQGFTEQMDTTKYRLRSVVTRPRHRRALRDALDLR